MKSIKLPFNVVGGGIGSTTSSTTQVEQKIVDVLVTGKLERPMSPDYGAGVQQLLFDDIDELVEADFKIDAISEINGRVSGVTILEITVKPVTETEANITVYYRTPLSSVRSTSFNIVVPSTLTEETPL